MHRANFANYGLQKTALKLNLNFTFKNKKKAMSHRLQIATHTVTPSLRAEVGHLLLDFRDLLALLVVEVEPVSLPVPDLALHEPRLLGRQSFAATPFAERRHEVEEVLPHRYLDAELAQLLRRLNRGFACLLEWNSGIPKN